MLANFYNFTLQTALIVELQVFQNVFPIVEQNIQSFNKMISVKQKQDGKYEQVGLFINI